MGATRVSEDSIICPMCLERVPPEYIVCPYCGYDMTKIVHEAAVGALGTREIFGRIRKVIQQPRLAMKDIADHPDRMGGVLIMLALSIFLILSRGPAYLLRGGIEGMDPVGMITSLVLPLLILGGVLFFIVPFLFWVLGSAIFWIIAKLIGGRGVNFAQTQGVVGYGLTPLALWAFISIPILLIGLPSGDINTMANSTVEYILTILMIPALVWSLILIGIGLTRAHAFTHYEGIIIAALPILGFLLVII